MGKLDVQSTVTLIINGEQSKTSLKEVTQAVNATTAALAAMKKADDPKPYQEKVEALHKLKAAQTELRNEIFKGAEAQKGFFADFKKGFAELEEIAAHVTIGTLIYKGISFALDGIKELFTGSQQAYDEAQRTQTQLQQVLRTTGGVAGETKEQLEKYQKTLMDQTGIDDDVIAKGEEMLLTFTNIRGKIYEQALPAIVDMTAAMNGGRVTMESIQATAIQVGKALNDPINGMTALKKVGVTLDETQKQQIITMQKGNDMMGAQAVILKELQKEFGGTAKAIADTDVGKLQKFTTAWDNLKEKIGGGIVSMKAGLADFFQSMVEEAARTGSFAEKLTEDFYKQKESVESLEKVTTPLIDRYDELTTKGELNKNEQVELNKIIQTLSQTIPGAVTQWDKYGHAIGINTDKARDFIKMQKAVLQIQNKDAIESTEDLIKEMTDRQARLQAIVSSGKTIVAGSRITESSNGGPVTRALTPKEILDYETQVGDLQKKIEAATLGVKGLKGEMLDIPEKSTEPEKPQSGPTKADLDAAARKAEREKKELLDYQNQLRETRDQIDQLIAGATKGTISGLDAQLKVIDDKYKKLIAKLQELNANKNATSTDKNTNNKQIKDLQVDNTAAQLLATNDADFKNDLATIKAQNQQKQDLLAAQYDKQLISQEKFNAEKDKLDEKGLEDEYYLAVFYGENTLDIEKRLADAQIRNGKRVADEHIKNVRLQHQVDEDYLKAKEGIEAAKAQLVNSGFAVANEIFGKNKALMLAELAIEDFVAIGKIKAQEGVEIASYFAKYALVPGGEFIAAGLAAAAETRADISIAEIIVASVAKGIGELSSGSSTKMAKGGLLSGPSHPEGGIPLINGNNGQQIAEVEGGETVAVFSKAATANNQMLIRELLYNSQYRNGAPVRVNTAMATIPANGYYTSGGIIPHFGNASNTRPAPAGSAATDMSETNRLLAGLHDKFDAWANKPWDFNMRQFRIVQDRLDQIDKNAKA